MTDNELKLTNLEDGKTRDFLFDNCMWSHDTYEETSTGKRE
jgi:hypothetical protein